MIDAHDKKTQPLVLEQPKRGRGRPATGKAMTPAEKQKAYRERLAKERANQVPTTWHREVRTAQDERIEQLEQQLADAKGETAAAISREETAKRELKSRDANSTNDDHETIGVWWVEKREYKGRKWEIVGSGNEKFAEAKDSVDYMQFKSGSGRLASWRACRADGMIYWPKAPK